MERKTFINQCGMLCLAAILPSALLIGCAAPGLVKGVIKDNTLIIPKSAFVTSKNGKVSQRSYVLAYHDELNFPIILFPQPKYTAFLMQCSHQGAELQIHGDTIVCPAHGSEFDNKGNAIEGPATLPLRPFEVIEEAENLKIILA
jgi:Rieske Fe-S protein